MKPTISTTDIFYCEILDGDHRDHVCDAMRDAWCGIDLDRKTADALAGLVESDLIEPANDWLEREDRAIQVKYPGDLRRRKELSQSTDVAALMHFLECAREIHYRVKHNLFLLPEYADTLHEAWGAMLVAFVGIVKYVELGARAHEAYRIEQRRKAKLKRGRIEVDGEKTSITEILNQLAFKTDGLGDYLRSNELWPQLYATLESLGLKPEEDDFEYTFLGGQIKYASFKVLLSKTRANKVLS